MSEKRPGVGGRGSAGRARPKQSGYGPNHWRERLIHRKYTEKLHPKAGRELSMHMEHGGTSHYFPLGTDNRTLAATRALRIHKMIASEGWQSANSRFPRELSVAIRWADNPVAWTYTTIHSQPRNNVPSLAEPPLRKGAPQLKVAIAECDPGIRRALAWCLSQQEGVCCQATFESAAHLLQTLSAQPPHLVLISHSLADMPGTACLQELNAAAPSVPGVLFSVFEDADQLFKSAPGGAAGYLFRRTSPLSILEPIAATGFNGVLTAEQIAQSVQRYFEQAISAMQVGAPADDLANLTQREHQVLALLSKGQPDKEIADLLGISTWTVHGHLKKIFEKLGAHNRTEAVIKYLHK